MVTFIRPDYRDSHIVEIEFKNTDSAAQFISGVNSGAVVFLGAAAAGRQFRAGYAFGGAPTLVDTLEPRRNRFVAVSVPEAIASEDVVDFLRTRIGQEIHCALRRPMFLPANVPPPDPNLGQSSRRSAEGEPIMQWYIHRCAAPQAWKSTFGEGVVVADIDWGFYLDHEDLTGRYDPSESYNVLDDSTDVDIGEVFHGTGSAGLIGAAANGKGIVGFAPKCTLWFVQAGVMDDLGPVQGTDLVNPWATAIDHVIHRQPSIPRVINLEVQSGRKYSAESSCAIQGAIRRATAANVFVCLPAGNGGVCVDKTEDGYDISDTGGIVVAATGYDDIDNPLAAFSNFGQRVRLAAPGEPDNDLTCGVGGKNYYTPMYGGTSGASAKAAGGLALMLARNPGLKHHQLIAILGGHPVQGPSQQLYGAFLDCSALSDAAYRAPQPPEKPKRSKIKTLSLKKALRKR